MHSSVIMHACLRYMYVCMYVCIYYTYIHTCDAGSVSAHELEHMHSSMIMHAWFIYIHTYIYTHIYTYIHVMQVTSVRTEAEHMRNSTTMNVCVCVYIYIYTHIHVIQANVSAHCSRSD
jgi:hypothetical protein